MCAFLVLMFIASALPHCFASLQRSKLLKLETASLTHLGFETGLAEVPSCPRTRRSTAIVLLLWLSVLVLFPTDVYLSSVSVLPHSHFA